MLTPLINVNIKNKKLISKIKRIVPSFGGAGGGYKWNSTLVESLPGFSWAVSFVVTGFHPVLFMFIPFGDLAHF